MPLTQAEMDFMTNHAYELHNFDRASLAHQALRSLDPQHGITWDRLRVFQYVWQEQGYRSGLAESFFPWDESPSLPPVILPWSSLESFHSRYQELYPESIYLQFESGGHPLRYPRFVSHRTARFFIQPVPIFTPDECEFLDAYHDEIRAGKSGPCLIAADDLKIPYGEIIILIGCRGTELLHLCQPWPQPHSPAPPIPWPTLEAFKLRFFPPRPDYPRYHYVTLVRADLSAKEHVFLSHYFQEITTLTPGPAHEYLRTQSLSPVLMLPFHHSAFKVHALLQGFLSQPLPPFQIPWANKSVFFTRVLFFCDSGSLKKLVEPFLPPEDSAYLIKPHPYRFFLSQPEEDFVLWYLAEMAGATGDMKPATHWLWTNGIFPSSLEAFLHAYRQPNDYNYDCEYNNPLPPYRSPWLTKDEFEERLKTALEAFPELKDNPTVLPGYLPEGYEARRSEWLRSIPNPPIPDSFPAPGKSS